MNRFLTAAAVGSLLVMTSACQYVPIATEASRPNPFTVIRPGMIPQAPPNGSHFRDFGIFGGDCD
jgi:hypothetical protein